MYVGYSFDQMTFSPLSMVVPEQRILTSVSNRRYEAVQVLDDLRNGRIVGRAVLLP